MRSVGVLCVIFVSFAAATGVRAQGEVGVFDTQDGGVFGVHVEEIVSWLNRKEDVGCPKPCAIGTTMLREGISGRSRSPSYVFS